MSGRRESREGGCCYKRESHVYLGGSEREYSEERGDDVDEAGRNRICWEGVGRRGGRGT